MDFTPRQIVDFHAFQARRVTVLRDLGDKAGLWRHCPEAGCKRRHGCIRNDTACYHEAVSALMTDADRAYFRIAFELMAAGVPRQKAFAQAQAKIAEHERALRDLDGEAPGTTS